MLSVNKFLLVTAAALVVLAALTATPGHPVRKWPLGVWGVLALAVVLLAALSCRSRPVRILPFKNLTSGDGTGPAAAAAAGFAELLDSEIRRIVELVRQEPFMTPADVLNPAGQRGDMVQRSSARVPFKTGVTATGLPGDIKPTEVGTVTLGPLKLQVGTMLTWMQRLFGTTLQGSLVEADGVLQVVASQSGLRGGPTWSAQVRIDDDVRRADGRLARELAHRIEFERPGASESGADVDSFQRLVDGLDSYQRFQQEGVLQFLDEAEDQFRAALARSPGYAAAYHNLGLVYREQRRVRTDIGLPTSTALGDGPTLMWQRAVTLDPTIVPARIQLARAFVEKAGHPDTDAVRRVEFLEQAVESAHSALEQPSHTHPMEGALASYWLGVALLKQGEQQQHTNPDGNAPDGKVREALQHFRRAEQDLVDERGRRLVHEGNTAAVRQLTTRIAYVVSLESKCWSEFTQGAEGRARRKSLKMAQRCIRTAIGWAPDMAELHALVGRMSRELGLAGTLFTYLEALQRDPQNHHVMPEDVGGFIGITGTNRETRELATDVFTLIAHQQPDDAVAWLLLASVVPGERAARSLAGKALALEPGREDVLRTVLKRWPPPRGTTPKGEDPFSRRWAQAWAEAREAQQAVDEERLSKALDRIEKLCGERGGSLPEISFVDREIGLLHGALALLTRPSDNQRAHWSTAVHHLTRSVNGDQPARLEPPPLWCVELADAHAALADSQSDAGRGDNADKNYEEAVRNYTVAIGKSPKTVRPRYRTGRRGQERLTELTAEDPDLSPRARATAGRAAVYASQGRIGEAVRDCRDALKLAPLYAYPRFTLALLYRDQRAQYDLAEQTLKRLIEILPAGEQRDRARLNLARTYRKQAETSPDGDRERLLARAREKLVKATRESSLSADMEAQMHEELATVLDLLGRSDEAIVTLRAIGGTDQQSDAALYHERIADLLAESEQPWEVERELLKALEACSARLDMSRGTDEEQTLLAKLATLNARLAIFYADQGIKLNDAHLKADSALKSATSILDPGGLAVFEDARGWVAYREGRDDEAIDLLERAVEHSGGDPRERAHLACALEARSRRRPWHRRRDVDRARYNWQQVLDHFPRSPAAEQARHHLDQLPEHLHPPRPLASRGL